MRSAVRLAGLVALSVAVGCSRATPSADDAREAFERELLAQVSPKATVGSFRKTDGLTYRQDGVDAYDLEFAADVEVPGRRFERDVFRGKVTFIRSENGWRVRNVNAGGEAESAAKQREDRDRAAVAKIASDVRLIEAMVNLYKLDNFVYPTTEQGLRALIEKPTTAPLPPNWKPDGYLRRMPVDPWGNPYRYENPGTRGVEIEIYSLGADNAPGGDGAAMDLGNWLYRP